MKKNRIWGAVLAAAMLLAAAPPGAGAAETPHYRVEGEADGSAYVLHIGTPGADAIGGRLALSYDTDKVRLTGGDSFAAIHAANGVELADDRAGVGELISAERGQVGFAWFTMGRLRDGALATLRFSLVDGVTPADFDAATFRLRYVPPEGFGSWTGAAYLAVRGSGVVPDTYHYLRERANDLAVEFSYPGSGTPPENGVTQRIRCADLLGEPVRAAVELAGGRYESDADGVITLRLAPDTYRYRVTAEGFGTQYGALEADGTDKSLLFVTDELLVQQAVQALAIGYAGNDSAAHVTGSLQLTAETESGVRVAWTSSAPAVVSHSGLVYRPAAGKPDETVTLTAALSHGAASAEKKFLVKVLARPLQPEKPGDSSGGSEDPQSAAARFRDLSGYPWAGEAIEFLAGEGIIKGTGDGVFSPGARITRADYLLLVMRMMGGGSPATGAPFDDVPQDAYYAEAVTAARALGVTEGTGYNRFSPELPVTRQEMATLTAKAMQKTDYLRLAEKQSDLSAFADADEVADWARDSVARMVQAGFLVGADGRLDPRGDTNRAEAAVFLYRIYAAHA